MRVLRQAPEQTDQQVALTIGNFDGVHIGHKAMLTRLVDAARQRGIPSAVMTFEPQPQEFFAPDQAPARLTSLREKLELLEAEGIDIVFACRFDYAMAQMPADRFVERIGVQGLRPGEHSGHGLDHNTHDVVQGLLCGQRDAGGLAMR